MKKYFFNLLLFFICCGCAEDIVVEDNTVTFYGSVIDYETGNPIQNASVVLYYGVAPISLGAAISSAYTGTDGSFSFSRIEIREETGFVLKAECAGYQKAWHTLSKTSGNKVEVQIIMQKSK